VTLVGLGAFVLVARGVRSDDEGGFVFGGTEKEPAAV
jgi:hypothetical protein